MKLTEKHLYWLMLAIPLCCLVDTMNGRKVDKDTVGGQARTRRLFARQKTSPPAEGVSPKRKTEVVTPVRRCSLQRETCSSSVPCCNPCSACRCRFFNTVCHCWKMNHPCVKRRKTPRMGIGA
ncbi:agouti-related protein-like [Entelurus aequoreus]|uniref:agouti-related protein-like n=1 Tax=Entelurus aequoreus TaxID=161455 RepID=UPI002B1D2499|nr:agouti-related protein-like [Entelurus aequoreus]XP_061925268.1 agouti-related protein-like [Entelurus aequoreus]